MKVKDAAVYVVAQCPGPGLGPSHSAQSLGGGSYQNHTIVVTNVGAPNPVFHTTARVGNVG